MKKSLVLFCFCALFFNLRAQVITSVMDATYSRISPNGVYSYGNYEDLSFYYNAETEFKTVLQGDNLDDGGCWVWDINDLGQLAVEHKKRAAIWTEQDGFEYLPMPDGVSETSYTAARCISNDGKVIVVSVGSQTRKIYVYTLEDSGVYSIEKLPIPKEDPMFHQGFQFVAPCDISGDGGLIVGRYRIETGFEELPLVWKKDSEGNWQYEWMNIDFIIEGGESEAVYPGEFEFDWSGLDVNNGEWQAEYDKAFAEYNEKLIEYYTLVYMNASGYFFSGNGDLSDVSLSNNGRFVKMNMSYQPNGSENVEANYPIVYEFATDSIYFFTCCPGSGCLSVTDEGVVSLSGLSDLFSWTYISSIENPAISTTLAEWTLNKSNGKINLADYMTYGTPNGPRLAEGTASLASSGNAFVTWQYNGFGDNMRYESYFVRFDVGENSGTNTENINGSEMLVYPNPTNGEVVIPFGFTEVEIFDITGRKVYVSSNVNSTIDLSSLNAGTYVLRAFNGEEYVSTKLIKK